MADFRGTEVWGSSCQSTPSFKWTIGRAPVWAYPCEKDETDAEISLLDFLSNERGERSWEGTVVPFDQLARFRPDLSQCDGNSGLVRRTARAVGASRRLRHGRRREPACADRKALLSALRGTMPSPVCSGCGGPGGLRNRRCGDGDDVPFVNPAHRGRGAVVGDDGDADAFGTECGRSGEERGPWRAWIRSGVGDLPASGAERDLPSRWRVGRGGRRRDAVRIPGNHRLPSAVGALHARRGNDGSAEVWGGPDSLGALRYLPERIPRTRGSPGRGKVSRDVIGAGGCGQRTVSTADRGPDRAPRRCPAPPVPVDVEQPAGRGAGARCPAAARRRPGSPRSYAERPQHRRVYPAEPYSS